MGTHESTVCQFIRFHPAADDWVCHSGRPRQKLGTDHWLMSQHKNVKISQILPANHSKSNSKSLEKTKKKVYWHSGTWNWSENVPPCRGNKFRCGFLQFWPRCRRYFLQNFAQWLIDLIDMNMYWCGQQQFTIGLRTQTQRQTAETRAPPENKCKRKVMSAKRF